MDTQKMVLVIGGGRGVGAATATLFCQARKLLKQSIGWRQINLPFRLETS